MAAITSIQIRRGTASQWTTANPVLLAGEMGLELDTKKFKFGDGASTWSALEYFISAVGAHTHPVGELSDATTVGQNLVKAADAAAARAAIGAGTSNLALGTTSTTAMRGDKTFAFSEITGIIGTAQLPPLAINDTFPVASQAAMLALTAQRGDIAIRTDEGKSYVLATDSPSTLADWKELVTGNAVTSVAGKVGAVVLAKGDVGLANVDNTSDAAKPVSTATQNALNGKEPTIAAGTAAQYWRGDKTWATHDKASVGLGSVDNTSDLAKPVSTATQNALNAKANTASPTFTGTVSGITKSMVGLGSVDNTSDAAKPISSATQTALNGKANASHTHGTADILTIDGGTP